MMQPRLLDQDEDGQIVALRRDAPREINPGMVLDRTDVMLSNSQSGLGQIFNSLTNKLHR